MFVGAAFNTGWTYNSADLPETMTYPDDETVTYDYNNRMLLETLTGSASYVTGTEYDAAGRIDLRTFGNGTQTDHQYFPWNQQGGRLQYLKSGTPGDLTSLQSLEYAYDPAGNVDWIKDWKAGDLSGPQLQDFGYDVLDRLTSAQVTGGAEGLYSETYSYDPTTGNLQSKNGLNYTYSTAHPHAVTGFNGNTYSYDANGNMTQRVINSQTYTLGYDAENRLVSVSGPNGFSASFAYNGDGQRVQSTIAGVTTSFVGNYYEISGSTATKYYYAGAARIAMRAGTSLYYLLGDHLGSTSVVTDSSGVLLVETRYKPFGEVRYATTGMTLPTRYTFTGQFSYVSDEATDAGGFGLMFFNARFYDPALGRFSSSDTIIPGAGNPQAWDRYAFVNNNPVRYTDPSGHRICDENGINGSCEKFTPGTLTQVRVALRAYGVNLGTRGSAAWNYSDALSSYLGVYTVASSLSHVSGLSAASIFKQAFGSMTFKLRNDLAYFGVASDGYIEFQAGKVSARLTAHELGHSFERHMWANAGGKYADDNPLTMLIEKGVYDVEGNLVTGKGLENRYNGNIAPDNGYQCDNYQMECQWHSRDVDGWNNEVEDWADIFLNWSYGSFYPNAAGNALFYWVESNMVGWLSN